MELEQCFELFDLDRSCTPEQARQAYRDLVHVWHPDRFGDNLRLRQKAEDKLKEINVAFDQIMKAITSYPSAAMRQTERAAHRDTTADPRRPGPFVSGAVPPRPSEKPAPKFQPDWSPKQFRYGRSAGASVGKYLLIGFICVLVAITVIILNFLSKFDPAATDVTMPATSELRKIIRDFEKTLPGSQTSRSSSPSGAPTDSTEAPTSGQDPQKPKHYYEIHLKSGTVIVTEDWWEKEDMIIYRINRGTMGIERRNVASIVRQ